MKNQLAKLIMESSQLSQYFRENAIDISIPQQFIDQFIENYNNRNQKVSSEVLYEWYCAAGYSSKYEDFIKIIRKCLDENEYQEIKSGNQNTPKKAGRPRKIYNISQQGVKEIMMIGDKQTRKYFIQLEQILFKFIDQYMILQELKNKELNARNESLEETIKLMRQEMQQVLSSNQYISNNVEELKDTVENIGEELRDVFDALNNACQTRSVKINPVESQQEFFILMQHKVQLNQYKAIRIQAVNKESRKKLLSSKEGYNINPVLEVAISNSIEILQVLKEKPTEGIKANKVSIVTTGVSTDQLINVINNIINNKYEPVQRVIEKAKSRSKTLLKY